MALNKDQQQKILLGVVVVVTFCYVYFKYLLAPTRASIAETETQLQSVLQRVDSLKMTASRLPQLRKQTEELDLQVAKVEKRLPRTRNLEDIIRIVTELAKKNGVSFSSFSPAGESSQTYYTEVPFTLNVTGTMHSIGKFLSVIGQQERIFSAKNLNISYSPNTKKGYTISGTFTLYAFIYNG
ncbi:MAG: type 4a pilus biogenesis protein PilO [Elusimicrobia bacterium]|nr:type 4a pilus biogenesis protein PilO [Elusimicrobiota bacterium]